MDSSSFSWQFQNYLCGEVKLSGSERAELRWRRIAFLSFAFVIFAVGLPVWWLTTTPYRAALSVLGAEYELALEKNFSSFFPSSAASAESGGDVWDVLRPQSDYSEIGVEVLISAEHLWDFSLSDFVSDRRKESPAIVDIDSSDQQMPASLCSELDRLMGSAPLNRESLLKLAVFWPPFDDAMDIRLTHNGESTVGLAIASWGGLFIPPQFADDENAVSAALLNALLAVLQFQFSMFKETLLQHKRRLVVENLMQTLRTLNALHKLSENIDDLVIPDEVARLSADSKVLFLKAFNDLADRNHFDSESAAEARRLAERANTDPSLLELLNFPSEQKYGVYVPLFLPLLLKKRWRRTTEDEKAKNE
uniref:Uncharacterized protein n=1 Tax=Globodera rostochiensis TaxID=31243 RepID=A0A914GTV3_GLORO